MSKSFLFQFQKYIVLLLPIFLVTGPFLPDLAIVLASIIFLYLSIKNKLWIYYKNKFFLFFLFFYITLLISSLLSQDVFFSLESSLFYFRFGLFSLSVWFLLDHDKDFLKLFFYVLLLMFGILIFDGFFQYFTGSNLMGLPYNASKARLSSFFGDEWVYGNYLSRLFPLLFALAIFRYREPKKIIILLCLFILASDVIIYLSGERIAFFNLIFGTVLMIILLDKFKWVRIISFVASLIIIITLSVNHNQIKLRMIDNTINQINFFSENYVADHELFVISSFKMFKDNMIIGVGPKMYRKLCDNENYYVSNEFWNSCSTHPHNIYLQLLSETGMIGFIFILAIFIYILFLLLINFKNKFTKDKMYLNDYQICLYIALLITLFPIIPSFNFFNNWINIIYFLPIGFLLNTYYSKNNSR